MSDELLGVIEVESSKPYVKDVYDVVRVDGPDLETVCVEAGERHELGDRVRWPNELVTVMSRATLYDPDGNEIEMAELGR